MLIKNAAAKGKRVSTRVVRRVSASDGPQEQPTRKNLTLPGLASDHENSESDENTPDET
jgi:hypothetical protein